MPRPGPGRPRFVSKTITKDGMYEMCQKMAQLHELARQTDSYGEGISDEEMRLYNEAEMNLTSAARAAKRLMALIDRKRG